MRVLIETRMNSLKLNESKAPKKGCLGRLEGVCADFKNPTRNGRLYPLELWKKVFNDSLFKEALDNKTLFGELDHPEDRFEPLMSKACIVMTDYTINEDEGLIYGGFDILDTPEGRILKSILNYGSVLGVSSRGQGDIIESADGERVDEDSYEFACFDVVSTPAVEKARQKVMESVKRVKDISFKESVTNQIKDAETVSDLNIIRSVIRTSNLKESEMDSLIESIEDKCKSLQNADKTIVAKDESKTTETLKESAKTIRDNRQLYSCIKGLRSTVSAYKHRESRYVETIQNDKEMIESLKQQLAKARRNVAESKRQQTAKEELHENRIRSKSQRLTEANDMIRNLEKKNQRLDSMYKEQLGIVREQKQIANESTISARNMETEISNLTEKLSKAEDRVRYLEQKFDNTQTEHSNEITNLDKEVSDYSALLSEAQCRLDDKTNTIKELTESVKSLKQELETQKSMNSGLSKQVKSFQNKYVEKLSNMNGLNAKHIKESITLNTTPEGIESIVESACDRLDRYSGFPISSKSIANSENVLMEGIKSSMTDEEKEDARLGAFLLQASQSI